MTTEKGKIQCLDENVINKIAAGEVIVRPSSALKELLENSLDAGSTSITVTIGNGGLRLLQIQDNGHGIQKDDLPLVCTRFATSKLKTYNDLMNLQTYGFRGEAMASISFAAKVTVVSMAIGSSCAYRANYTNGTMIGQATPCAGIRGTLITVENMFADMPARRAAIKNISEEYNRCCEIVERYAIMHSHRGISFSCRKAGEGSTGAPPSAPDVHISAKTSISDAIGIIFGTSVKKDLQTFTIDINNNTSGTLEAKANITAYFTTANFISKKAISILFINSRLVECSSLRRAVDIVYSSVLPKGSHAFTFFALEIPPESIDVNVHPTKREVHFLHEDMIIDSIVARLRSALSNTNLSRSFSTASQSALTFVPAEVAGPISASSSNPITNITTLKNEDTMQNSMDSTIIGAVGHVSKVRTTTTTSPATQSSPTLNLAPSKTVRVDSQQTTLLQYLVKDASKQPTETKAEKQMNVHETNEQDDNMEDEEDILDFQILPSKGPTFCKSSLLNTGGRNIGLANSLVTFPMEISSKRKRNENSIESDTKNTNIQTNPSGIELTSVLELLEAIQADEHPTLANIFSKFSFIGIIDRHRSIVQYNTKLLLVGHTQLIRELFYQQVLRLFSYAPFIALNPPLDIHFAISLAIRARSPLTLSIETLETSINTELSPPQQQEEEDATIKEAVELLISKADMLKEYFSIVITQQDSKIFLTHIPKLLDNYIPLSIHIPDFLLSLAFDVDWLDEKNCFHTIAQVLAAYYAELPPPIPPTDDDENNDEKEKLQSSSSTIEGMIDINHSQTNELQKTISNSTPSTSFSSETIYPSTNTTTNSVKTKISRMDPKSLYFIMAAILFPALRNGLIPPRKLSTHNHIIQLACTEKLYRIFERC